MRRPGVVLCLALTAAVAAGAARAGLYPPRGTRAAKQHLRADVTRLSGDYVHRRYAALCSDLIPVALKAVGGRRGCGARVKALEKALPVKRFSVTAERLNRRHNVATVSAYLDGRKTRAVRILLEWSGGRYRLARPIGSLPPGA